jgi:hypothetical protein
LRDEVLCKLLSSEQYDSRDLAAAEKIHFLDRLNCAMSVEKEFNFLPACKIYENYWPQLGATKNSAGENNYHSY